MDVKSRCSRSIGPERNGKRAEEAKSYARGIGLLVTEAAISDPIYGVLVVVPL